MQREGRLPDLMLHPQRRYTCPVLTHGTVASQPSQEAPAWGFLACSRVAEQGKLTVALASWQVMVMRGTACFTEEMKSDAAVF